MPIFEYKAVNGAGKNVKGTINAQNSTEARTRLRKEGIFLTDIKESASASAGASVPGNIKLSGRVSLEDITIMTRQLATLVGAGVTLVESLGALTEQAENLQLKKALSDVKEKVNEGSSMAEALKPYQEIFSPLFVNMIRAGEASGGATFEKILTRLADYSENQSKLQGKVTSAVAYPLFMMVVGVGAMIAIFTFVIPKLVDLYSNLGQALPLPTQILIATSKAFTSYWYVLIALAFITFFSLRAYLKTAKGKRRLHQTMLTMPIFGSMFRMIAISRFASTLSTLLSSGVPILQAMEIVKSVIGNIILEEILQKVRTNLSEGDSIAEPLRKSGEFPPLVTHMIAIGERTGELEAMLAKLSETYSRQVESKIAAAVSLIEPIMMLVLMMGMGFVVISVMLPIFNMTQAMG